MAKINNKCNSNSFYKNLIYIDILCNNCIFLVFCFYILYIAPLSGVFVPVTYILNMVVCHVLFPE